MLSGPAFLNESGHIKNMKIIMKTVDFGIPTIKFFLSIKIFLRAVGIIEILRNLHINTQNFVMI